MTKQKTNWREYFEKFLKERIALRREIGNTRLSDIDAANIFYTHFYCGIEHLVFDAGTYYRPRRLPERFRSRQLGQCYQNAYLVAKQNRDIRYVEGFATIGDGHMPTEHAWNLDKDNRVVDTTWEKLWGDKNEPDNPKGYYGIVIPTDILTMIISIKHYYGVIDDAENHYPFLKYKWNTRQLRRYIKTLKEQKDDASKATKKSGR